MKILIVLTSHSKLGNTHGKTGFWIEEFATPYYLFKGAGANITLASPKGGQPPIDSRSDAPENQTESTIRYKNDSQILSLMANTKVLSEVRSDDFDAIFYLGGHGPLWDLTNDIYSIKLIEDFWEENKPVATVCHSPSVLLKAKDIDGNLIISGKNVTGFSNEEEDEVKLVDAVPFLLENALMSKGGFYSKKKPWESYVIKDGLLITGQNPQSSEAVAEELILLLQDISVLENIH